MHIYLYLYIIHTCNSWTSWQLYAIMKQSDWRELQLRPFFCTGRGCNPRIPSQIGEIRMIVVDIPLWFVAVPKSVLVF